MSSRHPQPGGLCPENTECVSENMRHGAGSWNHSPGLQAESKLRAWGKGPAGTEDKHLPKRTEPGVTCAGNGACAVRAFSSCC